MALILPPFYFGYCTSSFPSGDATTPTAPTSGPGHAVTFGANDADGSVVAAVTPSHDVHYLIVSVTGNFSSGVDAKSLLDVVSDPAGGTSWGSFIDDLVCGGTNNTTSGYQTHYHFPIWIAAGTALGLRGRTHHTSNLTLPRIVVQCFGEPSRPDMWWCGQKVETLGVTASGSDGTNVTPGASTAWGSWTTIGTSTYRYGAIQYGTNGVNTATATDKGYWLQVGVGSKQLPGSPTGYYGFTSGEAGLRVGNSMPIWCDIPGSTAIQMRAACGQASPDTLDLACYGVY